MKKGPERCRYCGPHMRNIRKPRGTFFPRTVTATLGMRSEGSLEELLCQMHKLELQCARNRNFIFLIPKGLCHN
jgi:hypothetical protein